MNKLERGIKQIGFESSTNELVDLWMEAQRAERQDDGKMNRGYWVHFHNYCEAKIGLLTGIYDKEKVGRYIDDLLNYEWPLPDFVRFYVETAERVMSMTAKGSTRYQDAFLIHELMIGQLPEVIKRIKRPFERAAEMIAFIKQFSPDNGEGLFEVEAEIVLTNLPLLMEQVGSTSVNDRVFETYRGIDWIYEMARETGKDRVVRKIEGVLLSMLERSDLKEMGAKWAGRLLSFYRDVEGPNEELKKKQVERCVGLFKGDGRLSEIIEVGVSIYLKLNDFEGAVRLWKEHYPDNLGFGNLPTDLIEYALRNNLQDRMREEKSWFFQHGFDGHGNFSPWNLSWLFAAERLIKDGIFVMEEPEVLSALGHVTAIISEDLIMLSRKYPDKSKFGMVIKDRVKYDLEKIRTWNHEKQSGDMPYREVRALIEGILAFRRI